MKALILAAGYAVRLYPLTKKYPKPLLKVGRKAIIDYIIDKLRKIEQIDEIIIVTNSRFISVFDKWSRKVRIDKTVSVLDDLTSTPEDRRGAIGDMDFAVVQKKIKDDLLVIGGDNLFDGDLDEFLSFAKNKKNAPVIGVYDLKDLSQANKYGVMKLDKRGRVTDFAEKPAKPKSSLVAMCLYYFPKSRLKLIPQYFRIRNKQYDATGFYINWLRKKCSVYGFIFTKNWYDIGDYKFYNEAKKKFGKINS